MKPSKGLSILTAVLLVLSSVLVLFASGCIDFSPSSKAVDLEEAAPGETLTYTLNIINQGDEPAPDTVVTDIIDANLENVGNITAGGVYDPGTRTITWELGDVPSGGQMELIFTADIMPSTPVGTVIENHASITWTGGGPSDSNTVETTVIAADPLDHFTFDPVSSPQTEGQPFSVTIYAKDAAGEMVTSFEGTANLSDLSGTIYPTETTSNFDAVSAGAYHSLALKSDGSLAGWGNNDHGRADVPSGNDYTAVSAGGCHSLALKSDGSLTGWGFDNHGQATPPAGNDYTAVSAGGYHSLALRTDGSLVGWGENLYGQADVPTGNDYVEISAGLYHSLALKSDGSLVAWGVNNHGQTDVPSGNDYAAISAGVNHNLAIRSDGSLTGWGYNDHGETDVPSGNDHAAVSAGNYHSLALKNDGSLAAWGYNNYGQTDVPPGNDHTAVSAGDHHNLALKSDGSIVGWGYNGYGQTDVPPSHFTAGVFTGEVTIGAPYSSDTITAEHSGKTGVSNAFDVEALVPDFSTSTKGVDLPEAAPGDTLAYSLQVINSGDGEATSSVVTDYLDSSLENVSDITGGGIYESGEHKVTWDLGTLEPSVQEDLSFTAQVTTSTAPGYVIGNQAQIDCTELDPVSTNTVETTVIPGPVDHFSISNVASPQYTDVAFPITITALDVYENTATSFTSSVTITDTTGTIAPAQSGAFSGGVWTGDVVVSQASAACEITVDDGDTHTGTSNSFEVITDTTYPDAEITSPTEGQVLTDLSVMVTGTAYDVNLDWWQLSYRVEGSGDWTPLSAPHTNPVQDGDLESWDLSGLSDGVVHLKLTVTDLLGLTSEDIVGVVIERDDPVADITWPETDDVIGGLVDITGSALDGNLKSYKVSFGEGASPVTWYTISPNPSTPEIDQSDFDASNPIYISDNQMDLAQTFLTSNGYIDKVDLTLTRTGYADAYVGLKICEYDLGAPTFNLVAESVTTYHFGDIEEDQSYTFEFKNEQLITDTTYCLVLYRLDGQTDPSNYVKWCTQNSDVYAGGNAWKYSNTSGWESWSGSDFCFSVHTYDEAGLSGTGEVSDGLLASWNSSEATEGACVLKLDVTDDYGKQASDEVTVVVDNTYPTADITYPASGDHIKGLIDITGTATDDHFLKYQVSYGVGEEPTEFIPISGEVYTPVTDGTLAAWDTTGLTDGPYTLKLSVEDEAGLTSEYLSPVTVDNTPPTAGITSPVQGEVVCGTLYIQGEAADTNFASYSISYTQDPDPDSPEAQWTLVEESTNPPGANLCTLDTTDMAEIPLWMELSVSDKAGSESTARVQFSIDNTFPQVYFESPEEGAVWDQVQISGVAHDANISFYELYVWDGESMNTLIEPTGGGTGTNPEHLYTWDTSGSVDGSHILLLRAEDETGHKTTAARRVRVDNAPPAGTLTILGSISDNEHTDSTDVKLLMEVQDAEYVKIWNYDPADPGYVPEESYLINPGGGPIDSDIERDWTIPGGEDGIKEVRCLLIDADGTLSETYTDTITLDSTQPTVNVTEAPPQESRNESVVHFGITAVDEGDPASGIDRVVILYTLGGAPLESEEADHAGGDTYTKDIDLTEKGFGYYDFIVKAYDKAGNATATGSFPYHYTGFSEWSMQGYDLRNSHYNAGTYPGEMLWPYEVKWENHDDLGAYASNRSRPPVEKDGYIYFQEHGGELYDPEKKMAVYKVKADSEGVVSHDAVYLYDPGATDLEFYGEGMCFAGNYLYVLTSHKIHILNPADMTLVQDPIDIGNYIGGGNENFCAIVASGDYLYLSTYDESTNGGHVLALNRSDLSQKWIYTTPNSATRVVVSGGKVIFCDGFYLYALDAETELPTPPGFSIGSESGYPRYRGTPTVYNDRVYVRSSASYSEHNISIVELAEDGFGVILTTEGISDLATDIACANNIFYVSWPEPGGQYQDSHAKIYAFDASTGSTMWSKDITEDTDDIWTKGPTIADALAYFTYTVPWGEGRRTYLVAYDAFSGHERWRSDDELFTSGFAYTSDTTPAISKGRIYLNAYDHGTFCFEPEFKVDDLNALGFDTFCGFYEGINTSLGSFTHGETDITLPGRGLDIEFKRTYNSYKPEGGYVDYGLGRGWDFSYNIYIDEVYKEGEPETPENLEAVKIHRGDGRVDSYTKEDNGTFKPPPGVFDHLAEGRFEYIGSGDPNVVYTLKVAGGYLWEFEDLDASPDEEDIRLKRIIDDHSPGDNPTHDSTKDNIMKLSYEEIEGENRLTWVEAPWVEPPGERRVHLVWAAGHIQSVTEYNVGQQYRTTGYSYDDDGDLHKVTDIYGGETDHGYDPDEPGRLISIEEPCGNTSKKIDYYGAGDPNEGMVSATNDAYDNATSFAYATTAHMTIITDPRGYTTSHRYDTLYRLIQEVDNAGNSVTYSYGDDGNGKAVRDPMGRITQFTSDEGKVTEIINPDGGVRQFTYEEGEDKAYKDRIISEKDEEGNERTYQYNDYNNLIRTTDFCGEVTRYFYENDTEEEVDNPGLVTLKVMPSINSGDGPNPTIEYIYYPNGDLEWEILYEDWNGNEEDPQGVSPVSFNNYFYDAVGRIDSEHLGKPSFIESSPIHYDYTYFDDASGGNLLGVKKVNTRYSHATIYPTEYTLYDANGRLAEVITSRGDTDIKWIKSKYTYDDNNRETREEIFTSNDPSDPPGGSWDPVYSPSQKGYFNNGMLAWESDHQGRKTLYTYDDAGRLRSEKKENLQEYRTTYLYFPDGQVKVRTDPLSQGGEWVSYAYDSAGRQSMEKRILNSAIYGEITYKTETSYDLRGNLSEEKTTRVIPVPILDPENPQNDDLNNLSYDDATNSYTYDEEGRVETETRSLGEGHTVTTEYKYDPMGNKIEEKMTSTLPDGVQWLTSWEYNAQGKAVKEIRDCDYGVSNEATYATYFTYDTLGYVLTETVCDGVDQSSQVLSHREYTYNGLGRIEKVEAAVGAGPDFSLGTYSGVGGLELKEIASYDHLCDGLLVSETRNNEDSPDQTAIYSYDALENKTLESWTRGDGTDFVNAFTYDGAGNMLTESVGYDTDIRTTSYTYDDADRITSMIVPRAESEGLSARTYTYDHIDGERRIRETDPEERLISHYLDVLGREEITMTPGQGGLYILRAYDQSGEVIREMSRLRPDPSGDVFKQAFLTYDDLGRKVSESILGEELDKSVLYTTSYEYDAAGNPLKVRSPEGNETLYLYDTCNRLRRQELPHEGASKVITEYEYDALGRKRLTLEGEQGGQDATRFTYDGLSNLRKVEQWDHPWMEGQEPTGPDVQKATTSYEVDLSGNLLSVEDARLNVTTYSYNACGWQTKETEPDGGEVDISYSAYGETTDRVIKDPSTGQPARTLFTEYDGRGRLASEGAIDGDPQGQVKERINYRYDHTGNITRAEQVVDDEEPLNNKKHIDMTYDSHSRLRVVNSYMEEGDAQDSYQTSYTYHDSGELASRTTAACTSTFDYDKAGRLSIINDNGVSGDKYTLTWDDDFRLTSMTLPNSSGHIDYTYYGEGLVESQTAFSPSEEQASYEYTYNDRGKRSEMKVNIGSLGWTDHTYAYDYDSMGRLTDFTPHVGMGEDISYEYDEAGNLITRTVGQTDYTYTYDEMNRIETGPDGTYSYDIHGNLEQVGDKTFTYDDLGRLETFSDGTDSVDFSYDPLNRLHERSLEGSATMTFRYDGTSLSQTQELADGQVLTSYALTPAGTHLAQMRQSTLSYIGLNPHTDVSFTLTSSGTFEGGRIYDPYGNLLQDSIEEDCSLGYQEDYTDPSANLVWMGARWYSPELTRLLSEDPLAGEMDDPLSQNPYLYCMDDPINAFDPSGMYGINIIHSESIFGHSRDYNPSFGSVAEVNMAIQNHLDEIGRHQKWLQGLDYGITRHFLGKGIDLSRKADVYKALENTVLGVQIRIHKNAINYHSKCINHLQAEKRRLEILEAQQRRRIEEEAKEWKAGYQDRKNQRNQMTAQALAEGRWRDAAVIAKDQAYDDYLMGYKSRDDYQKSCGNIDKNANYLADVHDEWKHKKALEEGDPGAIMREMYKGTNPGLGVRGAYTAEQANDFEAGYDVWMNNNFIGSLEGKTLPYRFDIGFTIGPITFNWSYSSVDGWDFNVGVNSPGFAVYAFITEDPNPHNDPGEVVTVSGGLIGGGGVSYEIKSGDVRTHGGVYIGWPPGGFGGTNESPGKEQLLSP